MAITRGDFFKNPTTFQRIGQVNSTMFVFPPNEIIEVICFNDPDQQEWAANLLLGQVWEHGPYRIDPEAYRLNPDGYFKFQDALGRERCIKSLTRQHETHHKADNASRTKKNMDAIDRDDYDQVILEVRDAMLVQAKGQDALSLQAWKNKLLHGVRHTPGLDYFKMKMGPLRQVASERNIAFGQKISQEDLVLKLMADDEAATAMTPVGAAVEASRADQATETPATAE